MALIDLQREVQRLCLEREAPAAPLGGVQRPEVWLLYREMVRERLFRELRVALRRTFALAGEGRMRAAFDAQLAESPPRTRRFFEVAGSFAAATLPRWRRDPQLPGHLADLLEYEATLWEVGDLDDRLEAEPIEFSFDRPVVLAPALRLIQLSHRVHRRGAEAIAEPTRLLVYRRAAEPRARSWVLNEISYALMQRIALAGTTPAGEIRALAGERGFQVDEAFLDGLCTVLSKFIEAGVILGSRAP
jgi:hypothetical protein